MNVRSISESLMYIVNELMILKAGKLIGKLSNYHQWPCHFDLSIFFLAKIRIFYLIIQQKKEKNCIPLVENPMSNDNIFRIKRIPSFLDIIINL